MNAAATGSSRFALAAAFLIAACDDVSPLAYEPPEADVPDAVDVDPARTASCRSCAYDDGAPCRALYDSCSAQDPRCKPYLDCMLETGCWQQFFTGGMTSLVSYPPCLTPCLAAGGFSGVNDAIPVVGGFLLCASDPTQCQEPCFLIPMM